MTEETLEEGTEETGKEKAGEETKNDELNEIERLAAYIGWDPNYEGKNKYDAKTFIKNSRDIQDSFKNAHKESLQEIARLRKGVEKTKDYFKRVDAKRQEKAEAEIKRLTKERMDAIKEGDVDKVESLESKIDKTLDDTESLMEEDRENPDFDEWIKDNDWYGKDPEMTQYADEQSELSKYKGVPYKRMLGLIEKTTKEIFEDKFKKTEPAKKTTPKVEGTKARTSSRAPSRKDMDSDQIAMMKEILAVSDSLTEKEYINGLREAGEI